MKVIIIKQTVAAKKNVRRGDVLELPKSEAQFLIRIKKAAEYSKELEAELSKEKKEVVKDDGKKQKPGKPAKPGKEGAEETPQAE